ncbi:thiol-disulfide oxidoreductase DCC family protein [Thermomonas sp.]|uniref:thiol-disulfide oxidoreductase DCC family protein n=1 Tax=Thermomonas sp. TaxID=1971895 RepID=UPI002487DF88|nr:thiol-disulfide oxidoreductase DCC family protein [Thermomonas sp.]MDI1254320.1 thiol-disulfide oxidoreductase DCC family protein [Thermomonas sp.]
MSEVTQLKDAPVADHANQVAIIVFDGVCVLCNGWVRFLLRHDRKRRYRFAAMQTPAGRALLAEHGLDPDDPTSFLLIEHDRGSDPRVSLGVTAIRRVLVGLGGVWRLLAIAAVVPRVMGDPLYLMLARNRYRWFGRHDACLMPDPANTSRFL